MKLIRKQATLLFPLLMITAFLLAACKPGVSSPTPAATEASTATPAPTAVPQKTLVVCLGYEPGSLYMYKESSRAMWSVL